MATFSSVPASVTLVVMTLCTLKLYIGTILLPRLFPLEPAPRLPLTDSLSPLTPEIPLIAETLLVTEVWETTEEARDNLRLLRFCFSLSDDDGVEWLTPSGSDPPPPGTDLKTSLSLPLGFLTMDERRLPPFGSAIVMCVFLPVGLSPGIGTTPGVEGGLGAGVDRREGISGRRRPPVGLFKIEGEGKSSGSPMDSCPVAVEETEAFCKSVPKI